MKPVYDSSGVQIYQGDCLEVLRELPSESVQCCVTSPPYWGLRDYGLPPSVWPVQRSQGVVRCSNGDHLWEEEIIDTEVGRGNWAQGTNGRGELQPGGVDVKREPIRAQAIRGFCTLCGAWRGCFGLEPTPDLYVAHGVAIFREVRRVLRSDGTLWLNMGDSYAANRPGGQPIPTNTGNKNGHYGVTAVPLGMKAKDLCGIPWLLAFALRADGWYLRSDIIWDKPNPMPESVTDRPTKSHEYIFLLSKSGRYYYDAEAIKEAVTGEAHARGNGVNPKARNWKTPDGWDTSVGNGGHGSFHREGREKGKNEQSGDRKKVGFNERWDQREASRNKQNESFSAAVSGLVDSRNKRSVWTVATQPFPEAHFATFPEELIKPCILAGCKAGDTVLDPFGGSGTTALVAQALHCRAILIELNSDYIEIGKKRLKQDVFSFTGEP